MDWKNHDIPFSPEKYNLTEDSSFLDIGSGFGKPNFHAAMQIGVRDSLGIEVVEARVIVSNDLLWEFKEEDQEEESAGEGIEE